MDNAICILDIRSWANYNKITQKGLSYGTIVYSKKRSGGKKYENCRCIFRNKKRIKRFHV